MLHFSELTTLNYNNSLTTTLEDILAYKNKGLIFKFCETYNMTTKEAEEIFDETKKFLYLCSKTETINIAIYQPMLIIDEMWHMFILFTKDYHNFCIKYFGYYLHHLPETKKNNTTKKDIDDFNNQLIEIVKHLGKDTLVKWYNEHAKKYSTDNINKLRKPLKNKILKNKKSLHITDDILTKDANDIVNFINPLKGYVKCNYRCEKDCRKDRYENHLA